VGGGVVGGGFWTFGGSGGGGCGGVGLLHSTMWVGEWVRGVGGVGGVVDVHGPAPYNPLST